jgi:glycosyltransferase involved in cell wall biosynthesis
VVRFVHPRLTAVWRAMRRAAADVYYCSCAGLLPGQLALYARFCHRPVATVFRLGHDSDASRSELLIPNGRAKALYRYGLPRMDLVLAQSELQHGLLRTNWSVDAEVVKSLVDLPPWPSREVKDIDVLWVSNLRPFKRPEMVLDLAASMPQVQVHMVGGSQPGLQDYYAALEERARGIPSLRFHGPLPYEDTTRLIARARVLINTSESEGFPNTYLQAWARGVPTIGLFDPDGVIARHGLGAAAGSLDALRDAVSRLLADAPSREALGARCRAYVESVHGRPALERYADLIENAWRRKRGAEAG